MAIRILSNENITGSFEVSGKVGIGTAPTSRNLSVFRGTAGSVANFLHYTDASNFAGLYIGVSQSSQTVSLNASGSSGGNFEMQCGNATVLTLNNSSATFTGFATFTGKVDSINGEGFRLKNAANSANEGGFTRSGYWEGNTNRDPGIFAETGLSLRFYTGGSGTPKMILSSTGNVGIGTGTNIYGDLHLQGGQQDIILTNTAADGVAGLTISRIIGQARGYSNNGAVMQSIDFVTNSGAWYKGDIVFKTNNTDGTDTTVAATEKMRIKADGSINIGERRAALPSNFGYSSSYKTLILGSSGTNYTTDAVTLSLGVDVSGNPSGSYNGNGREIIIRNEGAFISPNASNNGYNTILSWNSSGQPYFNQNVGIGITSPQKNLQIFQAEGGVGAKHATIRLGGYSTVGADISAYRVTGNSNDQGLIFSTYDATNGTVDTMTLTNAGNVGIGTTSPGAKLEIADTTPTLRITNTTDPLGDGTVGTIEFFTNDSSTGAARAVSVIECDNQAGSAVPEGELVFKTSLGGSGSPVATEKMRIDSSGNVGIGTTSPLSKFEVYGGNSGVNDVDRYVRFKASNGEKRFDFHIGGTGNASRLSMFAADGATEGARISSSGNSWLTNNVGIGTVSPDQTGYGYKTLTIMGGTVAGYAGVLELLTPSTTANGQNLGIVSFGVGGTRNAMIGAVRESANNNGTLQFWTSADANGIAKRMSILANGNVIIGTETSTACTLKVSSTKNGSESSPHFCITGNGYSALHWLDTNAYNIVSNSVGRDIEIRANINGVILTPGATAWASNSDIALKENINPLEDVLDKIKDYRCVEYNLKNSPEDKKIGFIAQDWENDFSAIVNKDKKGMLSMKYTETIPVLLKAIQELKAEIDLLKNK